MRCPLVDKGCQTQQAAGGNLCSRLGKSASCHVQQAAVLERDGRSVLRRTSEKLPLDACPWAMPKTTAERPALQYCNGQEHHNLSPLCLMYACMPAGQWHGQQWHIGG